MGTRNGIVTLGQHQKNVLAREQVLSVPKEQTRNTSLTAMTTQTMHVLVINVTTAITASSGGSERQMI